MFFKEPAYGTPATQEQLDIMTNLVKEVYSLADEYGAAPSSDPYGCPVRIPYPLQIIGLDIEAWLQQGIVDLLITSSYLQLNGWEYSVALGHRYGVRFILL